MHFIRRSGSPSKVRRFTESSAARDTDPGCERHWEVMASSARIGSGTGSRLRQWLGFALALSASACASGARPVVAPTPEVPPTVSWLHEEDEGAQRLAQFGALHERVRLLLIAAGAQADWVRHGVAELPVDTCRAVLPAQNVDLALTRDCSLIAVDAATAVLILSESASCERWSCLEHSWVFLSDYDVPLPLPARRAADYGSLRADLSRDVAEALWLAGYRGRSDPRLVDANDPYAPDVDEAYAEELPRIASYRSCTLAPGGSELLCRSDQGGVIGLDPRTSAQRVVASLERELRDGASLDAGDQLERVWWTPRGELALKVKMQRHPLCGEGACTLVGLLPWPTRASDAPRFVRLAQP